MDHPGITEAQGAAEAEYIRRYPYHTWGRNPYFEQAEEPE